VKKQNRKFYLQFNLTKKFKRRKSNIGTGTISNCACENFVIYFISDTDPVQPKQKIPDPVASSDDCGQLIDLKWLSLEMVCAFSGLVVKSYTKIRAAATHFFG
jgi:hypothetical protein